ncbi:MAG: SPOR domain-containing protein [Candidatus Omnitrophica bacterium]|nr:SPOR domain-containing protein [Candidatus Omnitrophota bacterium]
MKKNILILTVFLMLPSITVQANYSIERIEAELMKDNFDAVVDYSLKALDEDTLSLYEKDEATYYLALGYFLLGNHDQAYTFYDGLLENKNASFAVREKSFLGKYEIDYNQQRYEEAIISLKDLLRLSPNTAFMSLVYYKMARAHLKLANWDTARTYLNKVVAQYPYSMEAYPSKQLLEEKQYFAVQVGSFLEKSRAVELVDELKQRNEYAYIVETLDQNRRKFYRVRVGQLAVLSEAEQLKSRLAKQGYPTKIFP